MKISLTSLNNLIDQALSKYGYNEHESKVIKGILMYAQLRGNNQGIVKLIGSGIPKREGNGEIGFVKETPVSGLIDGNKNHAMVVMDYITDIAIEKAKKSGIAIVGNFNSSESTGALGYYVEKLAKEGLIGFAYASAPFTTTAPYGSNEAKFCTNPMAYGIPTQDEPIILDFTTSSMAWYGLIEAKTAGKSVPEGLGYDLDGKETTNPAEIMGGAIKAFAGQKGSGLAMIVQILAGPLVQADSFDNDSENAGNLVIAIDPNILTDANKFIEEVTKMKDEIKSSRKAEGFDEILIPGERGNSLRKTILDSGEIEIEDNLLEGLKQVVAS